MGLAVAARGALALDPRDAVVARLARHGPCAVRRWSIHTVVTDTNRHGLRTSLGTVVKRASAVDLVGYCISIMYANQRDVEADDV